MSSSTDPENLPSRRARDYDGAREDANAREDDTRAFDRPRTDDDATRTYPAARTHPEESDTTRTQQETRAYSGTPGASATRDYVPAAPVADPGLADRETAFIREKEQFGGIKPGSAFFGWLTATGMAVLLTALVAAAGTAVGLANNADVGDAVSEVANNGTIGLVGIIVLLVILLVSYYCGGYVAGRMARFNGAKQGLMVWIWALIAAIVMAVLGIVAGQRFNVLASLNSFPRIPINEGELTTTSIIAAVVVAAVALLGAVLGGLAGMRFHRKVDRAGFTPESDYRDE